MKWLRLQFRTFIAIYRGWRTHFTPGGQMLSVAVLVCVPWLFSSQSALLLLCVPLVVLLLLAAVVNVALRPRLAVSLADEPLLICGEPSLLCLRFDNRSHFPALAMHAQLLALREVWQSHDAPPPVTLGGGAATLVEFPLTPLRRGIFVAPSLRIASSYPLHLLHFWQSMQVSGVVAVAPSYRALALCEWPSIGAALGELQRLEPRAARDSDQYVGNQEYVPGVPVRRWDFASWARLQRPVVREYREAPQGCAALVIDNLIVESHHDRRPDATFEALLSLAATLGDVLLARDLQLDLCLAQYGAAEPLRRVVSQRELLLNLAAAERVPRDCFQALIERLWQGDCQARLVVVLCQAWDDARRELCHALAASGCHLVPLLVGAGGAVPSEFDGHWIDPADVLAGEVRFA